jgi:hypothetical protein
MRRDGGWPSLSRSLRRLGLFSQSTAPQKNCHPGRSFSSRTGWEAEWRDLLFLSGYNNSEMPWNALLRRSLRAQ